MQAHPVHAIAIDSADDARVAAFRDVQDAALRVRQGLFVVEGRSCVETLVRHGRFSTEAVFVTTTAHASMRSMWSELPPGAALYVASKPVLGEIVGFDFHRGCLAVGRRRDEATIEEITQRDDPSSLLVALEDLTDVDNVGSVFRNALALGAAGVILSPRCCDPLYRRAVRVSMGAVLRLPYARARSWPADLIRLRARGHEIVALDPSANGQDLETFARAPRKAPLVVVAGTEGAGISEAVRREADAIVRIPMADAVDSINVATALAIALHRLARETRVSG